MTSDYNKLSFQFVGLNTVSFAIIDQAYKKTGETSLQSGLGFGVDVDDLTIVCNVKFEFSRKKDQPFLILEVQGQFEIEPRAFTDLISQNDGSSLVKANLATHFAVLTLGSARGILHAKTEGTLYNQFLLPTIDVKQMITEDILLN